MPRNDEINKQIFFNQQQHNLNNNYQVIGNGSNHENMLMLSLENYEVFLKYLKLFTHDKPRTLIDLARLNVRKHLQKPISNYLFQLELPKRINDFILLKDIQ